MGYRSILIAGACRISVKNEQLIIQKEEEHSIPIEDIRSIILENRSSTISTYALSELSLAGVCVFFCDDKHLPCAVLQPYARYSRPQKQLMLQLHLSKPAIKQVWQQIVISKITNQAKCLSLCEKEGADAVAAMAEKVRSGDVDNMEGQAAALYFRQLFGKSFSRSQESAVNAALNYGYAILRGYICRQLADYGFEPCIGIHHCSEVNRFNLADDLIEPFRPLVDLFVRRNIDEEETSLTPTIKGDLANVLNYEVLSGGERHSAAYAIERMIHSLERYYDKPTPAGLMLPSLEELIRHEYS